MARSRHRLAGFGAAWFLVTLLPASQVLPHHEIVADHYLYLPLVGVGLAVAAALVALEPWRRPAYAVAATVLVLLAARTVVRNRDFRDEATLWEATYAAVPASPRAAYNYGLVLTNRGDHQRAIPLYQQTIESDPTFVKAYFNLASTYAALRRVDDARAVYRAALTSDVDAAGRTWHMPPEVLRATYRTELAILDAQAGDTEAARDALAGILTQFPDLLRAEDAFATVVQQRGELTATVDVYRAHVDASPASVPDRLVLANLLWKAGKLDDAYRELSRAAAQPPDSCFANLYLARYYREVRPAAAPGPGAADDRFDHALRTALTPFDADAVRRARGDAPAPLAG
jgi:tetratricopeptide (TPR) repeat protein